MSLAATPARAQPADIEASVGGEPSTAPLAVAQALAGFIRAHAPLCVLTGAGCSTDSGIPDYRDRAGNWKRAEPIRYQRFVRDRAARRRYWARSYVGWPRVAAARPNPTHRALAALEARGLVTQIVTQNVDGLHQRAGARRVLDLHGRLDVVDCLDCGLRLSRERVQALLAAHNPGCVPVAAELSAPDGDVLLDDAMQAGFQVPECPRCDGLLKPAVVFFGENVPKPRVAHAMDQLARAGGLLVVGSSLTVFSGYRFCRQAAQASQPMALLNRGRTRADDLGGLKLDADCGATLTAALRLLSDDAQPPAPAAI
ncbi:MAG: NAD-dependent protein deacetylase [Gammaproteobacteria bacterium]|jgi:NAD-dependent SIR2 family protein deacetylase|nr:NAD-dependent protein deacetylase [Gammaproteobacteria bacterium]